jgi:hypothetical protein
MSGLYNSIFGFHPNAGFLLAQLGFIDETVNHEQLMQRIPRFRDCYMVEDEIMIYTRTGGGNREHYEDKNDDNPDGPWNSGLRQNPFYVRDEDCRMDSTYAMFFFSLPDTLKTMLEADPSIREQLSAEPPALRWKKAFDALDSEAHTESQRNSENDA